MRQNNYEVEKNVEKLKKGYYTGFLTRNIVDAVSGRLKGKNYHELILYPDADKTILYVDVLPKVRLFRIDCYDELKHSSILGSLYAFNITSEVFGDIVLYEHHFYIYLLDSICDLVINELTCIGSSPVTFTEVSPNYLEDFKKSYEEVRIISSSFRIDAIIAKLIGCNREIIRDFIKDKKVILNYQIVKKPECLLKENDVFSIRKYGKYRFKKILGITKKENYIILFDRFI